jgi:hypothetical protein
LNQGEILIRSQIITKVIEEMNDSPDDVQQQVLRFVVTLRQHLQSPSDAWDVLESFARTVEAPADWSAEHDYHLYGIPKR